MGGTRDGSEQGSREGSLHGFGNENGIGNCDESPYAGYRGNDDEDYEIYYVSEEALKLLLAGLGQKEWYGLFSGEAGQRHAMQSGAAEPGQRHAMQPRMGTVNSILAAMYQDGIIDWEDAGVSVRQPYAGMLSDMLEKKACVTVQAPGVASPIRCCYLSSASAVVTHKSQREAGTLGMAQIPLQGWLRMLEAECARLEDGECYQISRRSSENGRIYQNIRVFRDGLRSVRVEWDGNGSGCMRCACEEFGDKLRKMLSVETEFWK